MPTKRTYNSSDAFPADGYGTVEAAPEVADYSVVSDTGYSGTPSWAARPVQNVIDLDSGRYLSCAAFRHGHYSINSDPALRELQIGTTDGYTSTAISVCVDCIAAAQSSGSITFRIGKYLVDFVPGVTANRIKKGRS